MKLLKIAMLIFIFTGCANDNKKDEITKIEYASTPHSLSEIANRDIYKDKPKQKIGHVVIQVEDLANSQKFYERTLHMKTIEEAMFEGEKRVFMSSSNSHHEIVLKGGLEKDNSKSSRQVLQIAIQVDSKETLQQYYKELKEQGLKLDLKDNQISWGIYFNDPDGNQIEVYWDAREAVGRTMWKGEQEKLAVEKLLAE